MVALPHATAPSAILADIRSVADCDATLDAFTGFIVQAERRLATVLPRSLNEPAGWRAALTAELRIAKLTLPRMQERRADLKREERRQRHQEGPGGILAERKRFILVDLAWATERDAMIRVEALARERHPDLFPVEEAWT